MTRKRTYPDLTSEQIHVLRKYRDAVTLASDGSADWKRQLSADWMHAGSRFIDSDVWCTLQRLRNTHGPSWLATFELS